MKVTFSCCLCSESASVEVAVPDGWGLRYDGMDEERAFCPKHGPVVAFAESQCPGCVGGWGDCSMWKAFAYSYDRSISEQDLTRIEGGICPKRTNGTMMFTPATGLQDTDISERAPPDSGAAFAQAIRDYCAAYPPKQL
jgi:hypothetical protein